MARRHSVPIWQEAIRQPKALSSNFFIRHPGIGITILGAVVLALTGAEALSGAVPHALLHNQVLHEQIVLLTVISDERPRVAQSERVEVESCGKGFYRVSLNFGFIEEPDVPNARLHCRFDGLEWAPKSRCKSSRRPCGAAGTQPTI